MDIYDIYILWTNPISAIEQFQNSYWNDDAKNDAIEK